MRINNTSIQGLFKYSPAAHYEKGDFVVYRKSIYVCSPTNGADTVISEVPEGSKNFYTYLGDMMTTVKDYTDFTTSGGGVDKYISLNYLPAILNMYMQGFDGKGIIGSTISLTDKGDLVTEGTKKWTDKMSVLSQILIDTDINNAIFRVSRDLPEIIAYIGGKTGTGIESESCILRQYSFKDIYGKIIRVQELIDHQDGMIYYRSASINQSIESVSKTAFLCATINTTGLKRKAEDLFGLYASKIRALDNLTESFKRNFRYKKISLSGTRLQTVVLQKTDSTLAGWINGDGDITVNIMEEKKGGLAGTFASHQFTFAQGLGIENYYLTDTVSATITETSSTITISVPAGFFLADVFYQEFGT